jgi:hypothetical protein
MKKLNPLYLLALLVVIVLFVAYKSNQAKEELKEANNQLKQTKDLALKLSGIKKAYDYSKTKESKLLRLVSSKKNIKYQKNKDKFIIEGYGIDPIVVRNLISKILNDTYNITYLDIKKEAKKIYFKVEIKW